MKYKNTGFGGVLLCLATGSMALSLGPLQGAAVIGKPLNVQVLVRFNAGEDAAVGCLDAQVFHADALQDPTRVRARLEPVSGGAPDEALVRIVSSALVDEPVVTVNLRAGCSQRAAKSYVLLADVAAVEAAAAAPVVRQLSARNLPVPSRPPVPSKISVPYKSPAPARSRLKLEPLDLLLERDPVLRASAELLSAPHDDPQQRAQAAALWRALNASPEQTSLENARALRMESEIRSLHEVAASNEKGLLALTDRLERAQSQRYANPLVYSLTALLLLCMLGLVWLWRRLDAARGQDRLHEWTARAYAQPAPVPAPIAAPPAVAAAPIAHMNLDLDLDQEDSLWPSAWPQQPVLEPVAPRASVPVPVAPPPPVAAPVARTAIRSIDFEELIDLRQQVEFFMSLGQHARAIDILSARIAQCGESSPQLCLDLLKIYHDLGRQSDFDFMRDEFHAWFTGRVPAFATFANEGRTLESYPEVVARIVALWPHADVLECIEDYLFHRVAQAQEQFFDLQAYRELLFLHAVAKRIVRLSDGDAADPAQELLRVPAGAKVVPIRGSVARADSRAATHRAGAHLRGSRMSAKEPSDRVVALSAMRLPPVAPSDALQAPAQAGAESDSLHAGLTDFNFLRVN